MRDECYVEKGRLKENQVNSRACVQHSVWLINPKNQVFRVERAYFFYRTVEFYGRKVAKPPVSVLGPRLNCESMGKTSQFGPKYIGPAG